MDVSWAWPAMLCRPLAGIRPSLSNSRLAQVSVIEGAVDAGGSILNRALRPPIGHDWRDVRRPEAGNVDRVACSQWVWLARDPSELARCERSPAPSIASSNPSRPDA